MGAALPRRRLGPSVIGLLTFGACKAGPSPGAAPSPAAATTAPPATVPHVPNGWSFSLDKPAAVGDQGMVVTIRRRPPKRDSRCCAMAAMPWMPRWPPPSRSRGIAKRRQHWRRRIPRRVCRRDRPRARLPRDGAGGREPRHVSRRQGRDRRPIGDRPPRGGRSRKRGRAVGGASEARAPSRGRVSSSRRFAWRRPVSRWTHYAAGVIKAKAEQLARFPASASLYCLAARRWRRVPVSRPGSRPHPAAHRRAWPRRILQGRDRRPARRRDEARQGHHHGERPRRL